MNYCSDCDIAHESKICPLCVANDEIKQLLKELDALNQSNLTKE